MDPGGLHEDPVRTLGASMRSPEDPGGLHEDPVRTLGACMRIVRECRSIEDIKKRQGQNMCKSIVNYGGFCFSAIITVMSC